MTEPANTNSDVPKDPPVKQIVAGLLGIAGLGAMVFTCRYLGTNLSPGNYVALIDQHGHAILGIPLAASLAFMVVCAFRAIDGPVNLDFMGLKVKGSGGIIVLWIASFLAIVFAVRVLW